MKQIINGIWNASPSEIGMILIIFLAVWLLIIGTVTYWFYKHS